MNQVHHVPGRLRVRTSVIKKNTQRANEIRNQLLPVSGVTSVEVNTLTGSITMRYEAAITNHEALLEALRQEGCLRSDLPPQVEPGPLSAPAAFLAGPAAANAVAKIAKAAAFFLVEKALERSVLLLLAEVL